MSQLQVGFAALQDAANAAQGAAADAKGHGSADALTWAGGGIPVPPRSTTCVSSARAGTTRSPRG